MYPGDKFGFNNVTVEHSSTTTNYNDSQDATDGFTSAVTIFFTIGETLIALASVAGNGIVLYAIAKHTGLQTFTNYFIASLAVADLLVGAVGIPCSLVGFYGLPHGFWGCLFMNTTIIILTQISIFGLLTISLERYVAIQNPFFYEKHCNGYSATIIIISTWLVAITVGFVPVFGWNMKDSYTGDYCNFTDVVNMDYMIFFNFFGFVLAPLIVMLMVYGYIFHVVRKQMKKISSLEVPSHKLPNNSNNCDCNHSIYNIPNSSSQTFSSINQTSVPSSNHKIRKTFKRELRAAKWFAFVILLFAFCWLPVHIMNTVTRLASPVTPPLVLTAILLSHLNSAVNPILYAYSNTKFKTAMKRVLRCNVSNQPLEFSRSPNMEGSRSGNANHSFNSNANNSNYNRSYLLSANTPSLLVPPQLRDIASDSGIEQTSTKQIADHKDNLDVYALVTSGSSNKEEIKPRTHKRLY